ncbi:unnamed protein product [Adineta steineri]|uniref:CCHC-type domain-containing protein n=1 Tax=Adineta steineri TaxID=433720 RepID=A0A814KWE3_9BILA|nr:unnamed protein product [Adineta steineri]CAF1125241.1 unnamed protein product [Adineta steineri]
MKQRFEIAPLIVESENLTKVQLNKLIKDHLPEVKISNIQQSRQKSFTLYSIDVKSFNCLLNDLTAIIQTNTNQQVVIYIPKSIQRILDNNKEAYVKQIDLEITEDEIKQVLEEQGYKAEKITRLVNKDNEPLKTIKITFINAYNRDLFVKLGLQIDSMHFSAEPAKYNNKPAQCFKCFKFGHIAKYCKAEKQICSRCAEENHTHINCPNLQGSPVCRNCKGGHTATSTECSKYKEFQQKIQKTIDQYSSTSKVARTPAPNNNWNNLEEFPQLKSIDNINLIEKITEQIISAVEQATQRIFETLNKKFQTLANKLGFDIEIDAEAELEETVRIKNNINKNLGQTSPRNELYETNNNQNETPGIGIKRKDISPNILSQKSKNLNTNQSL